MLNLFSTEHNSLKEVPLLPNPLFLFAIFYSLGFLSEIVLAFSNPLFLSHLGLMLFWSQTLLSFKSPSAPPPRRNLANHEAPPLPSSPTSLPPRATAASPCQTGPGRCRIGLAAAYSMADACKLLHTISTYSSWAASRSTRVALLANGYRTGRPHPCHRSFAAYSIFSLFMKSIFGEIFHFEWRVICAKQLII